MVLLEAQACGKPVIAGRSGGTSEAMDPSSTGELVDCDAPEALAAAAVRLLDGVADRGDMGARARPWVVEHYDWRAIAKDAERLFARWQEVRT